MKQIRQLNVNNNLIYINNIIYGNSLSYTERLISSIKERKFNSIK